MDKQRPGAMAKTMGEVDVLDVLCSPETHMTFFIGGQPYCWSHSKRAGIYCVEAMISEALC